MADSQIEPVKQRLIEELSPDLIYLFGSYASGKQHSGSDLDVAFYADRTYDDYDIFILTQKLADLARRDVDLIQLKKASVVFRAQIVGTGKVIYCRDENKKDQFEMLTFRHYMKLNEERQIILDQIRERGSVYGNDVLINKMETIERCIKRILEDYNDDPNNLKNYTIQDAILMNFQRACETSIDLATYVVARKNLGVPQNSRDVFELLFHKGLLDQKITERMKAMVGFRNVAVHNDQQIDLSIVKQIIETHLDDLKKFEQIIIKQQ